MKEHVGCGCFPTGRHYPGIAHLLRVRARGTVVDLDADAAWIDLPIAVLDTETTGRDPANDRIVEIGVVVGVRGEVVKRLNWLVNPEIPIPDAAREVHGISDDDVKDAPTFKQLAGEIAEALRGVVPAAYNASFDKSFVAAELARSGLVLDAMPTCMRPEIEWVDPLVWARELQKYEKGKKLGEVAARLGIALENAHRASDDAEAALKVLYAFGGDTRVPRTYGALVQEQRRLGRAQEDSFAAWRARNPRP
ncbi:MAG: 3'-5' exonuclease [Deltaproteobacteria bacterium]|nr:3'-5' exonuclease [Deltaproteobacteria bacterium]